VAPSEPPAERGRPLLLVDPTTGRPILMAPARQRRPFHTGPGSMKSPCPFCAGQESATPPEIDAIREPGTAADAPGWSVRVFPNLYPANDHHEVIAEGAMHQEQPADLEVALWADVLRVWQRRLRALERRPGIRATFLFKNVGALAGASIAHSHSQVLGLGELPPRLQLERERARALGSCPWCDSLASAAADGRLVAQGPLHAALTPAAPRLPNEVWLLPRACDDDFLTTDVEALAPVLHALFRAVRDALGRPAFNLWLHRLPGERFHWHFELQPRTGQLAGLELGGDMYINSLPAAESAARLRAAAGS
jgi:UDPglucose--hexose-1-phosphate uridylyltransferase